jgi:hypothetical protein
MTGNDEKHRGKRVQGGKTVGMPSDIAVKNRFPMKVMSTSMQSSLGQKGSEEWTSRGRFDERFGLRVFF